MSYSRFSNADVYVFLDVGGFLNCCGCWLNEPGMFTATEDMLLHLDKHRQAGHVVPQHVFDALKEEAEDNDAWMDDCANGMCSYCEGSGICRDYAPHNVKGFCILCQGTKRCYHCDGRGGSKQWINESPRSSVRSWKPSEPDQTAGSGDATSPCSTPAPVALLEASPTATPTSPESTAAAKRSGSKSKPPTES